MSTGKPLLDRQSMIPVLLLSFTKHFFQYAQQIYRLRNKNGGKKRSLVLLGPGENADEPEEPPKKKRNHGIVRK